MRNINIFFLDSKEKRIILFFFFSSRRRHTRSTRDWSSDVCSSDLDAAFEVDGDQRLLGQAGPATQHQHERSEAWPTRIAWILGRHDVPISTLQSAAIVI